MSKKWVFEKLVENDQDVKGLIAYALYKNSKHNLAKTLRQEGNTEDYISSQAQTFHDQTVSNQTALDSYRSQSKIFLDDLIQSIEQHFEQQFSKKLQDEKKSFEEQKRQHAKDCEKRIIKEKKEFIQKIQALELKQLHWTVKLLRWVFSGVPKAIASTLVTILIFGLIVTFSVSEADKQTIISNFAKEIVNLSNKNSAP